MGKHTTHGAADTRQDNPVACPPAIVEPTPATIVRSKKVGKSGAVYLSGLAVGTSVNVAILDSATYIVSSRPADELRALTARIPPAPASPFAALAKLVEGRRHDSVAPRIRSPYTGPDALGLEDSDDDEAGLEVSRSRRRR